MKKRIFSFIMALVMVFTMLPIDAIALTTDANGVDVYEIGDTVWVRGEEAEPTGVTVDKAFWIPVYDDSDQPVTKQGLCGLTEHTHSYVCADDCALAHTHHEECYSDVYVGCAIHAHGEDCVTETVYSCGLEAHSHENCTASEKCTLEEHDHASCETAVNFTCETVEHIHSAVCPSQMVWKDCTMEEHTHNDGCKDAEGNLICGKDEHIHELTACGGESVYICEVGEHTHSVEAGCAYETVFTCGKTAHTHGDGSCVMETSYDCGKTAHSHENCTSSAVYVGCVEHLEHNENCTSEKQLTCGKDEHTCVTEGCAADCAITEHTHTAECDAEGVYYQWMVVEDTSATYADGATVTVSGNSYRRKYVVIVDSEGNEDVYYINSSNTIVAMDGTTAVTFAPGSYTIYYGPTGGRADRNFYKGTFTVNENSSSASASMSAVKYGSVSTNPTADQLRWAKSVYYNTSSFSHVDVRVAGNYVINIDGHAYTATVSNPSLTMIVNGVEGDTESTTSSTSYEWRLSEDSVSRGSSIVIELVVDLTYRDENNVRHTIEDVTVVYDSVDDLIKAIAVCDGVQGFDFIVTLEDIQQVISYYDVTYQWRVYNLDGSVSTDLPASLGAHGLPAAVTDLPEGTEYVYNTGYVQGTSYYDYDAGLMYTFHGWDTWSHSDVFNVDSSTAGYNALDDGDTVASNNATVPITADTWINGWWTVSELEPSDAYLMVKKVVNGDTHVQSYMTFSANKLFVSIDPGVDKDGDDAAQVDADYPALTAGKRIDVYQYDIPFVFEEKQADIPGYTRSTVISTEGENLALISEDGTVTGDIGYVSIDPEFDHSQAPYNLGTVIYTNTYTKKTGEAVDVFPQLTLWKTDYVPNSLAGVKFTLTDENENTTTYTTDANGYLNIPFTAAGTYYLQETATLNGYVLSDEVYTISVTAKGEAVEELRNGEFVMVTYYTLNVTVPEGSNAVFSTIASQSVETSTDNYRLHVYNEPIAADLVLSKAAMVGDVEMSAEDKANLSASVIVRGPITRDAAGEVTALGPTYNVTLNSENDWEETLSGLPYGEYLIHESFASVHGYTWQNVDYTNGNAAMQEYTYNGMTYVLFHVADIEDISVELTNTYTEWTSADFYIKKVNTGDTILPGAGFQLYTDAACTTEASGEFTTYAETDEYGYAWFKNFTTADADTDTYYLKEVKAPAGYYLSSTVYKVEIKAVTTNGKTTFEPKITALDGSAVSFDNATDLLTVVNEPVLGQLTVKKTFADEIPEGLTSVTAVVSGAGYSNTVTLNADNKWTATLTNLPLGTYTVTEQGANVPGYTLTTTYKVGATETAQVTLAESNPGYTAENTTFANTVEIINDYDRNEETYEVPTSLKIKKVGENGEALPGAQFTLTRKTDNHAITYTTNANGEVVFDHLSGTLDANGKPVSVNYTLAETKAPAGYAQTTETWTVTVQEDDGEVRIELNENKNIFENFWDWIIGSISGKQDTYTFAAATETAPATLTVKNVELADMTISKTITGATAPAGAVIEVAVLDANGELYEEVELTAAKNWTYTIEDMPAGKYTVAEATGSLHGYTWNGAEITVAGAESKAGTYANSVEVTVVDSAEISVAIENTYTAWESADFWIFKAKDDGTSPLSGATFTLYHDAALTDDVTEDYRDETITGNSTTGARGVVHFQGFVVAEGETDTFYLKETGAPANYYLDETVHVVTIKHDETGYDVEITGSFNHANDVLTVVNEEILGNLTIQKQWGEGNALVPGYVRVNVTGPNGYAKEVTLTAAKQWKETLTDLKLGEYTVVEQDASVDGYNLTVSYSDVKFPVTEDGHTITKTTENTAQFVGTETVNNTYTKNADVHNPASFEILKVGEDGTTPLAGAVFTLKDVNGKIVGTYTTGANGKVVITSDQLVGTLDGDGNPANATFTLTETTAPAGYVSVKTEWKITVKEDNGICRIVLNENTNLFENIWDWITGNTNETGEGWSWTDGVLTVENTTIKGDLTVNKAYVDADGALSADITKHARVELHVHGPITRENGVITDIGPLVEAITLENGVTTATVTGLEIGEYVLREPFASIHGYTWNGGSYQINGQNVTLETYNELTEFAAFKVTGETETPEIDVVLTNSYTVWDSAEFDIHKTDSVTKAGLEGVEFTLYEDFEMTQMVDKQVTDIAGYAHFDGITVPVGEQDATYYLKETKALDNYYPLDGKWEVRVRIKDGSYDIHILKVYGTSKEWDGEHDVLSVENTEILGQLTVEKKFVGGVAPEGIENVTVNVTGDNGYANTVVLTAAKQWKETLTGLKLGSYTVTEDTELAKVLGYTLVSTTYSAADGAIAVDDAAGDAVTITNEYKKNEGVINNPDSITIVKTDDQGKALGGAVFTLSDGRTFTTGTDGKVVIDGLIGNGTLAGQSSKTYTLEETTAPEGHVKSDTKWEIEVVEDDGKVHINLNAEKNSFENIWDWIVGNIDPDGKWDEDAKTLTVENARKTTKVEVSKTVVFEGVNQKDPFVKDYVNREYKFKLSYLDDNNRLVTETIKVKGGETKAFNAELPYGKAYRVEEITEEDFFNAEISSNCNGVIDEEDLDANITVAATNTYSFEVVDELSIALVKVASDTKRTPLKGAKFALYDVDGVIVESYTSDKNGAFTIEEITAPGQYTLKETKAPDGYYKLKKAITIDVDYEYTVEQVNGENVVVRTLVAEVSGNGVYARTDGSYGIKNTEITDNPKTGDQFNMGLWVGIGGFAAVALIVLLILGKKGKK